MSNGAQTLQIGAQTIDIYKKSTITEKQYWVDLEKMANSQ